MIDLISFGAPAYLLLLGLLPLIPRLARGSLEEPPGSRRQLSNWVRGALLLVVILALAEPRVRGQVDRLTTVFAVDASASIGDDGRERIRTALARAAAGRGPQDTAACVVFGEAAVVEAAPAPRVPTPPFQSTPGGDHSDPGAAVRLASGLFEPGVGRRIVVLTDGAENRGSLLEATSAAIAAGIDVVFLPIATSLPTDVRLESLSAPARAGRGEPVQLRAVVRSDRAATGQLRIYRSGELIASDEIQIDPDVANLFLVDNRPETAGVHTYSARIEVVGDPVPQNNLAEASVEIAGEPIVLLAGPHPERLQPLAALLGAQRIRTETTGLDGIPRRMSEMRRYSCILLANVAADDLGDTTMELLASYVRDAAGSLLMAGGERSFGPGGYLHTPIEEVLPVWMEVKERRYFPSVALVAAIDKSGSMAGIGPAQKLEVAKAGAKAAISILDDGDEAGVVGFDSAAQWVAKLRSLRDRGAIVRELGTLRAGGGTDIYPAMVEAQTALLASGMRVKHLILLSDGMSPPRDYNGLARAMAEERITVSTVAVGTDADTHTMRQIARAGRGRSYLATSPSMLPKIFTKEALTIQRSYVVEETFRAQQTGQHEAVGGIDFTGAPPLHGYVATFEKGQGELLLQSHRQDPVLSVWRVGLGKAVAFTADVDGGWSRDWSQWSGWGQMWSQIFRWATASSHLGGIHLRTEVEGGRLRIVADAVDDVGEFVNFAQLQATAAAPDGTRRQIGLRQVGPGRYEGELTADLAGAHLVSVTRSLDGAPTAAATATVDVPYSPEFRPRIDGRTVLEQVATQTGARLSEDLADAFAHNITIPGDQRALRPALLWLLPFLLLVDVGVRRVALPEDWLGRIAARLRPRRGATDLATGRLGQLRSAKARAAATGAEPAVTPGDTEATAPGPRPRPVATGTPLPTTAMPAPTTTPEPSKPEPSKPQPSKPQPSKPGPTSPPGSTTSRLLDLKKRRGR